MVASMVFNGHTLDAIDAMDEELFTDIQVMYADGMLGNRGVFDALGPITAAVFNYFRGPNQQPFKVEQIFPWVHEYMVNPDLEPDAQQKVSDSLLAFMTQAQGFDIKRFSHERDV